LSYYNLKKTLDEKGITQAEASRLIGVSLSTFNLKLNRARNRDFYLSEAVCLARYLSINVEDFF